jgi:hypothetical protein
MSSLDGLVTVAAVGAAAAAALIGWLLAARRARRGQPMMRPSGRWRTTVTVLVVLVAAAAADAVPIIATFWTLVALNFVLGQRENVPFSTYSMFSKPATTAWALRFEDAAGELVPVRLMGISPHVQKKRFDTEVQAARARGITDLGSARRAAAEVLAVEIEEHRRPDGKWAKTPITIALIEYNLASGSLVRVRTPLMETRPR